MIDMLVLVGWFENSDVSHEYVGRHLRTTLSDTLEIAIRTANSERFLEVLLGIPCECKKYSRVQLLVILLTYLPHQLRCLGILLGISWHFRVFGIDSIFQFFRVQLRRLLMLLLIPGGWRYFVYCRVLVNCTESSETLLNIVQDYGGAWQNKN